MEKQPCVYILASRPNGTLYIGVTSNLIGRVYQHRQKQIAGFTQRYDVHNLVWYEVHEQMESAIFREKQLKNWSRVAEKRLIELSNPMWQDVSPDLGLPSLAARQLLHALLYLLHPCSRGSRHSLPG
ncbi:GIY-YIG nuclease family protein [Methylobacter tundripaludum]|uniref:GIY-YIG nuclease family protein n=1 Tax=Methylobacter tundripaludum TaxID=173365 RepID=UPI0009DEEA81|nr:GIY-YIG nuclease family protein [Methylobacter tundripaludum]